MGDDQRPDAPSLEAPSLGKLFGRRKGRTPSADSTPEQPSTPAGPAPASASASGASEETSAGPVDWAPVEAEPAQQSQDAGSAAPLPPASEPAEGAAGADTTALPPVPPTGPPAPAPVTPPVPQPVARPVAQPVPGPTPGPTPADADADRPERAPARAPLATLTVDERVATGVTGLVVGLLVVVLTAGSLALCESVRGVSTCGGGPGFLLLVLVMAGMVVLGGVMLRLAQVPDPTSTSFLAVGLLCVLSLLFLIEVLDAWWMIIVIPLLSAAMFLLSHWVTTQVVDSDA